MDIYEVERDEYVGFIGQLNKLLMNVEQNHLKDSTSIIIKSKATQTLLCERIIYEDGSEKYYIYNMPSNDERVEPKPIMKVTLETRDEVEHFLNALSQLQKESKNDRTFY